MRIWDVDPRRLCQQHLLGEHRELHAIWIVLTQNKEGYSHHPETLRWKNKLLALYNRHRLLAEEMKNRGYKHQSSLNKKLALGSEKQDEYVDSYEEQIRILKKKECACKV